MNIRELGQVITEKNEDLNEAIGNLEISTAAIAIGVIIFYYIIHRFCKSSESYEYRDY